MIEDLDDNHMLIKGEHELWVRRELETEVCGLRPFHCPHPDVVCSSRRTRTVWMATLQIEISLVYPLIYLYSMEDLPSFGIPEFI